MKVYFILAEKMEAVKIGKANDINLRISDLQVGNPDELKLINQIDCATEEESFYVESQLHEKYKHLRIRGEWFKYCSDFEKKDIIKINKNDTGRTPLIIEGLFGQISLVDIEKHPRCYFYPHLVAQILHNYEESLKLRNPYRTMEYPTQGKQMLLPYSTKVNRVFISGRKHDENLELRRYNKLKETKSLIDFCK
jgi:hypothetical protein